jgi:hypothetical protein
MKILGMNIGFWWENRKKRDHLDDLDVDKRIVLEFVLQKHDWAVWTGFICLSI